MACPRVVLGTTAVTIGVLGLQGCSEDDPGPTDPYAGWTPVQTRVAQVLVPPGWSLDTARSRTVTDAGFSATFAETSDDEDLAFVVRDADDPSSSALRVRSGLAPDTTDAESWHTTVVSSELPDDREPYLPSEPPDSDVRGATTTRLTMVDYADGSAPWCRSDLMAVREVDGAEPDHYLLVTWDVGGECQSGSDLRDDLDLLPGGIRMGAPEAP